MWCMRIKIGMDDEHGTKTPSFNEIRKVTLQFLGDFTWNDPIQYSRLFLVLCDIEYFVYHLS